MQHAFESVLAGYLCAVAALKDDGSSFECLSLGKNGSTSELLCSLSIKFSLDSANYELREVALGIGCLPEAFTHWVAVRRRIMDETYSEEIEGRVLDRLAEEVRDFLGNRLSWFSLYRRAGAPVEIRLGAIWDVFIVQSTERAYAIHCSWDS